jgi:hypothetical protein
MAQNRLVSFIKTPLFLAKEYLHRKPDASFRHDFVDEPRKTEAAALSETMRKDGIVMLPGYFKGAQLQSLQESFEKVVEGKVCTAGNPACFVTTDYFRDDPVFLNAALDSFLLEIVAGYYQKPFSIGRSSAMRLLPYKTERYGSFQWHHDARGRQVHIMLLLSPVSSAGQRMTYLKGSQNTYYDHYRGLAGGSRFEKDINSDPELAPRITEVTGPAGTVAIFDANGLHSGNRSLAEKRDTLTFCYVSKRHFRKLCVRDSDMSALEPKKQEVIRFNPYCEITP